MSYAKDHEDEWLLAQFPPDFTGYAVELGALDGTFISCTKLLEEKGWDVLCIEPNPRHHEALRRDRKRVLTCACLDKPEEWRMMWERPGVTGNTLTTFYADSDGVGFKAVIMTLDQCLMISGFPRLDVLVLDVDGAEWPILNGFSIRQWKPKAIILEGNRDGSRDWLVEQGYKMAGTRADDNHLLLRSD